MRGVSYTSRGQDLSHAEGWDSEAGAVVGYINVVVNGIDDSSSTDATGDSEDTKDQETPSETPAEEEKILPITKMVNLMK